MMDAGGSLEDVPNHKSNLRALFSPRRLPSLIAHADWSCTPRKRWMAIARRQRDQYEVGPPEPVGELGSLFSRLEAQAGELPFVLGVDFPIGLPLAYAKAAGVTRFVDVLPNFGTTPWSKFYDIATAPQDITPHRPFYPRSMTSGSSRDHLVSGLGLSCWDELYRKCERRQGDRNAACPLFWTLGAQQVGRAAIVGWRDLLAPALARDRRLSACGPSTGGSTLYSMRVGGS